MRFQRECQFWDTLSPKRWFKVMSVCMSVVVVVVVSDCVKPRIETTSRSTHKTCIMIKIMLYKDHNIHGLFWKISNIDFNFQHEIMFGPKVVVLIYENLGCGWAPYGVLSRNRESKGSTYHFTIYICCKRLCLIPQTILLLIFNNN